MTTVLLYYMFINIVTFHLPLRKYWIIIKNIVVILLSWTGTNCKMLLMMKILTLFFIPARVFIFIFPARLLGGGGFPAVSFYFPSSSELRLDSSVSHSVFRPSWRRPTCSWRSTRSTTGSPGPSPTSDATPPPGR